MKKLVNLLLGVVLASVFMYFSYTIGEDYYFDDEIVDGEYYAEDFEEDLEELGEKHEGNITQEMYVNTKSNTYGLTTFEKAFQEVAYAYYMRGPYLHYNVTKGYGDVNAESPEEATSQDYNYLACGLFVMNVYKELLNIKFYQSTRQYAATYFGKRPEVIGYGIKQDGKLKWYDKDHDKDHPLENPTTGDIIPLLQIGDIIHHYGHEMLVYDLIYDDSGNVVDVYLIHANAGGGYRTRSKNHGDDEIYNISGNKVSIGIGHAPWANLYYNNIDNRGLYPGSRIEGTIKLQKFSEKGGNALLLDGNINHYASDYAILRFVTNSGGKDVLSFDGTYRAYTGEKIDNEEIGMDYYSDRVKSRLKYSKLFIEKTVDKRDNDMVEANQELTYTIKIQNNSDKAYDDDLIVKENINTNLVQNLGRYSYKINGIETNEIQLSNNGNQLQWNIGILNSGDEVTIEYTVKVKTGHIGETIESTGMIDNIPSGTLKNKIGKNTNKGEELKQSYNNLSGSYTGKILINQIYEETYGINLGLDNLKIQINTSGDVDGVIYFNNKWGTGSNWRDNTYLYINKKNIFSGMVLNSYFNALYKRSIIRSYNASGNEIKVQIYALPSLSTRENDPDVRANTIYPTDFQTGDILIYINENDIFYSIGENITVTGEDDNVLYSGPSTKETYRTYEDGEYAYIYIDGKFIGVNLGNDLTGTRDDRNEFTLSYYTDNNLSLYATSKYSTSLTTGFGTRSMPDGGVDWLQYQTLFGKDAYVVLRPSLMIRNINYELNGGENDDDNPSAFILGREVELKDPTRDGFTFQGWYTDLEYTIQVNNTNELMDDVMLYAKWKSNKCTFNGSIINHGESVTGYESNTVEYGDTCESEIRTCINGELSGTYQYGSCTVGQAASCTFNGSIINHGESVIGYESSTVEYGEICESEVRTCINGELSGTFQYGSCTEGQPASCTFNGGTINHGESVTGYESSTVSYGETCESEIRTCINGELSGTYQYGSCTEGQPAGCTFNGDTINHGESVTGYERSTVEYGEICESEIRTCTNGELSGTFQYGSCTEGQPASCTFNGGTINHGESVTGYESSTVSYGETCESEIRTCINGELSGTYQYGSCTVGQAASCTFNGNIINHGESVIGYESSTVEYGEICESEVRTCINGELSGTYQYGSCTEGQPAGCTFNGNIINHGESVTGYERSTVEYGEICESEIRTCTNGELSGTFIYPNCVVKHSFRGGVKLRKDNCPNGDFSDSYYDGRCGTPNNDNTHQSAGEIVYDILGFDSHYSDEMNKAYQYSYYYGITTKGSIEDADLYGNLTRIAMAKMLSQYALNVLGKEPDKTRQNTFLDVSNKLDLEYDNGVTLAYQLGIMGINMKDNKFRPYDTVSRAEFATALSRLLYGIDDGEDVYYSTHINLLKYLGIITNTDPTMEELRGYVMIMLMRSGTSL